MPDLKVTVERTVAGTIVDIATLRKQLS